MEPVVDSVTHFELEIEWRDQGSGEQQGQLLIELIRMEISIASWQFGPAPHDKSRKLVRGDIGTHYDLLGSAQQGDYFRLSYKVGDSIFDEEHELYIFFIRFKFWAEILTQQLEHAKEQAKKELQNEKQRGGGFGDRSASMAQS